MLALACNPVFSHRMRAFISSLGLADGDVVLKLVDPKAFGRAANKVLSDYQDYASPKGAFNVDVLRCLVVCETPAVLKTVCAALMTHFDPRGSACKVKNFFAADRAGRAAR